MGEAPVLSQGEIADSGELQVIEIPNATQPT